MHRLPFFRRRRQSEDESAREDPQTVLEYESPRGDVTDKATAGWKQDLAGFAKQFVAEAVVFVVGVVLVVWYFSRAH